MEAREAPGANGDAAHLVVQPLDPAKARRVVWIVLLVLAGMQAWAGRFAATPDGMSYVDLSDAIVSGHLSAIVNAYWSPLYPALLGALRLIFRPGPYWENAMLHLLNFLLFAASIAGFEYFLKALTTVAAKAGRHELETISGRVAAFAVFGVLSLMMTPLSLPTPDLLVSTAAFVVFGAMLRLRDEPRRRRHAVTLGVALAAGALAKSFFVPWSVVVFVATFIATRRSGWRPTALALATWLLFIGPWCVVLSAHQGYLTSGDTGRLTYIWNVNEVESPSLKVMPHGATTPASESALAGVAVMSNARGTNPVWFDPARWYSDLKVRWDPARELLVFSDIVSQFFGALLPVLLVVWFAYAIATREARALWARRVWVVVLPALAAMGAYALVLVTTRYIAPFLVVVTLAVCFTLPWPSRITPTRMLIGLGLPLFLLLATPGNENVLAFTNPPLAAVLFAWGFRRRQPRVMVVAALLGAASVWILVPASVHSFEVATALLVFGLYVWASRSAIRHHEARRFSHVIRRGLIIANAIVIGGVAALKYRSSLTSQQVVDGEPNIPWLVAEASRKAGLTPGTKVAIIGSPFEAYWARTARVQIVGVVPPWQGTAFRTLAPEKRSVLYTEFARVGASAVVSQSTLPPVIGDPTWAPYEYIGWVKRLP